jgi:hypothetical protein
MAHIRQSGPDSGLGFQMKVLKSSQGAPYSYLTESVDEAVLKKSIPAQILEVIFDIIDNEA